jgi:E3 ubiquitin-protein ligase LRSAM1
MYAFLSHIDAQKTLHEEETYTMDYLNDTDYKTRLAQKLCLSKENPEPIFDLSDCNLDKLPVSFAFIKVLRKEILIIGKNRLKSLASGGDLRDLELLKVLDISHNNFKAIPIEFCHLKNLKVSSDISISFIR